MLYNDLTITIAKRQDSAYPVLFVAEGIGRASAVLPLPDVGLKARLAEAARVPLPSHIEDALCAAGEALFRWLMPHDLETHLRIAWDRAARIGRGLRLRLSIDPPEIASFPWELLRDPVRDHCFAMAISTLLVRYLDQTGHFGGLVDAQARLPINLLLVAPTTSALNQDAECSAIMEATSPLEGALKIWLADGPVTRAGLADRLLAGRYDILHFSGHGGFADGQGHIALSDARGNPDWVDGQTLSWLVGNHTSLKLVVLNGCRTGLVSDGLAFRGLAPQLVRRGIPAVVAMQYPLSDEIAGTFARDFYRQLCTGENVGQVDLAVTHARNMLGVLYPGDRGWAAPVLYTHALEGTIFERPQVSAGRMSSTSPVRGDRTADLVRSLQTSMAFDEDWALAEPSQLIQWRETLKQTEEAYRAQTDHADAEVRQAARYGLALIQARLTSLESALNKAAP